MDDQGDPRGSKKPGPRVATTGHDAHHVGSAGADEVGSGTRPFLAALPPSQAEPDQSNPPIRRGNAFSVMRARGEDLSSLPLPLKSTGSSDSASPVNESKPNITRKRSGLDYDEELALPMPKPRHRREPPIEESPQKGTEDPRPPSHPRLQKKHSMPDTARARATPDPVTSADGKKKPRLEFIKSKLSFKDLRKDDGPIPAVPRMPSFDKDGASQRSASGGGVMAFSPSIYNFQPRAKPAPMTTSSARPMTSPVSPTQHNTAPSRTPLAPSGTYTHAHGSMTPSNASTGHRVDSWGQVKSATERVESKENPAAATQGSIPIPMGKHSPKVLETRPSPGVSAPKRSPTLPMSPSSDYAPTGDSPPTLRDLTEGSGKVKYLPRGWLESSSPRTPSPTVRLTRSGPTSIPESGPRSDPQPNFMPGFEERLEKIGLPLDKPTPPEIKNLSFDNHARDIVGMLRAFQRRTDLGITGLNQKLDELEQWLIDQLRTRIASVSDLERTEKELHSQQKAISNELRKFNLDIRLEMGVMDQRMNVVESKLQEEMESEIQSLALNMQELTQKTEEAIESFSAQSVRAAKMAEKQQAKLKEMEDEIAELHQKQATRIKFQPSLARIPPSPGLPRPIVRDSTTPMSTEPLIKPQEPPLPPVRVSPVPLSVSAIPPRQREATTAKDTNASSGFKRSLSIKKGLGKVASNDSGSQGKSRARVNSKGETKKWNIFGVRRRGPSNESTNSNNGSNKFGWLPSRRSRDGRASDNGSSRSVTPPPPIPRNILQNIENNIHAASQVHPAFRNMIQQTVMHDESLSSPSSPNTPTASMPPRMTSRLSRPDSQNMGVITASVAPSLASSHERRGASGEPLSPSLHNRTPESFNHSPRSPVAIRSIEDMRRPLLYGAEEDNYEWDHCSLHEAKSTASMR